MNKSFIERIFPHNPGSANALTQFENEGPVSLPRSAASPPRILLRDSATTTSSSPDRTRNGSLSPSRDHRYLISPPLIRHDDPFVHVERAAKNLERMLQRLLDAQSEGLSSSSVGMGEQDDISSVGSPTPTPSIATTPLSSSARPKTIPIRQPKEKKITLRGARRGLEKSMTEFAALKQQELALIDQEVVTRTDALVQASNLDKQGGQLELEINKIKSEEGPVGLRAETQAVEREIQELEATLLELKSKHRILRSQLSEVESSKDSELSSYKESLALNHRQVKSFLRRPPVHQSLNAGQDPGMYALKPERRTLQMAREQWASEIEILAQRKTSVENEKSALVEGSTLWRDVVQKIRQFEKDLRKQTDALAALPQPQLLSHDDDTTGLTTSEDVSIHGVLSRLSALISSLEKDLQEAEAKSWNLLICAIGAELTACEQARDALQETAGISSTDSNSVGELDNHSQEDDRLLQNERDQDQPSPDLLSEQLEDMLQSNGTRSPGESSNRSLEDTLREFGNPLDKGKQKAKDDSTAGFDLDPSPAPAPSQMRSLSPHENAGHAGIDAVRSAAIRPKPPGRRVTSESEDDEPGPEFLLSHS